MTVTNKEIMEQRMAYVRDAKNAISMLKTNIAMDTFDPNNFHLWEFAWSLEEDLTSLGVAIMCHHEGGAE